jgi:hypothetical protein
VDAFIRNNQQLVLSTLFLAVALLALGYSLGYTVLESSAANLQIAARHLKSETKLLAKNVERNVEAKEEVAKAIDSIPAFLEHINMLAQADKVIIRELTPDQDDKLKYRIEVWIDYPTFLRFTANLESLNVSISDMEIRPFLTSKTPPVHAITFNITPKNNAEPLQGERLQKLKQAVARQGKRNPFIRLVKVPGEEGPLFIDLTWVHKLSLITRVDEKLMAVIDNNDYAIGDKFTSVEGDITVQEVSKRRVTFVRKTDKGKQQYLMKFRKKKGRKRGESDRRRRGGKQRRR